ncbi:hypothetical protein [Ideonella sp.]|jgi:hypothetical protein|uniref:hypothetical protein n=1 Tax=Ideonella sp. TaxID=1929293 RepID=UPI0037C153C4
MSPGSLQTLRRTARGRAWSWLWALVLAVVLPSLWGAWHHVAHAPGLKGAAQPQFNAAAHDGHGSGTAECRLLDQAACTDGLGLALTAVPVVLAAPPRAATALGLGAAARMVASYAARAPPTHPVS